MLKSLFQFLGLHKDHTKYLDTFEPIYGMPKRSLEEWLSRNPNLMKDYEAKLAARAIRNHRSPYRAERRLTSSESARTFLGTSL